MEQPRLGKLPKKHDPRTLRMIRYLPQLPTPPVQVDHATLLPANNIGMMGNDKYGDCAVAAPGHMVQSWTAYAKRGMYTIPDSQILTAYRVLSPLDQGCYMLDVLNYWRKEGIGGDEIEGYVEIGVADLNHAKFAIQYFGSCYIGLALPDKNMYGPWEAVTGPAKQSNGHAVCLLAYDDNKKMFIAATWGKLVYMSYDWYRKYCEEGYAVLNDISIIMASGKSPEGFDFAALQEDLKHIGDPIVDPVVPDPIPIQGNTFQVTATPTGQLKVRSRDIAALIAKGNFSITFES